MKYQRIIQWTFLALFLILIFTGRIQIWMAVFFISLLGALFFSRFYCGWICPINTIMEQQDRWFRKQKKIRKPVPAWAKNPALRYGFLLIFLVLMASALRFGLKLPVLPALTVLGILVSLFFVPEFWHRYLCPYGTLQQIPGKAARKKWQVNSKECISCGLCVKVCPAEAVTIPESRSPAVVSPRDCLACTACARVCPKECIQYG
ncbi:MAG: 4Fe-4S binding protein [Tindallia sp. MSAO_Bac2]|nr:MAG: 4Fe-4S binding protein [Tindallia sp. MSAO_Bac2]